MTRLPTRLANRRVTGPLAAAAILWSAACMVGPTYRRPEAPTSPAFKEAPPAGWKAAQPDDAALRGAWWTIYRDPALDALEARVAVSNQNVLAAEAQFRAARDAARAARAALYPGVTGTVSATASKTPSTGLSGAAVNGATRTVAEMPAVDLSYQADVWGSIRRSARASAETAQASAAELENARLAIQASLAVFYFELHGVDGDIAVFENTVQSYSEYLALTQSRLKAGVASGADVAQAEAQLTTARAQLTDLGVGRAQFEHAIAILTGRPPAEVTIDRRALAGPPPPVPVAVPSALLERRPDIAAAERQMAAQNEQIGIARAALFPAVGVTGTAGLQGTAVAGLVDWPAAFWSLGVNATQLLFDAGRRRAIEQQQRELFSASVASYRQTVLTALQQVEDALSTLRILEVEAGQVDEAERAAQRSLDIATAQYKAGVVSYLPVLLAQAVLLQNQRSASDVLTRRLVASVQLVEALGGGWDASRLPAAASPGPGLR